MKKLHSIVFASFAGALFVLTGCASYSMVQTPTMKDRPPSCEDLHIHYAEWNYKDTFGNDYHTVGRCVKGMMHGEFSYMMNGNLIARTKYTRNAEVKTVCLVGKKHASLLSYCLNGTIRPLLSRHHQDSAFLTRLRRNHHNCTVSLLSGGSGRLRNLRRRLRIGMAALRLDGFVQADRKSVV